VSLQDLPSDRLVLRIGAPERQAAQEALADHLRKERLDKEEFARRLEACERAVDQGELLRVFADLPAPHPALPLPGQPPHAPPDSDLWEWACVLAILFGVPVAVVLGFTEDAWWTLAVPVGFCVLMVSTVALIARFRRV
jgi:hypothetical protein